MQAFTIKTNKSDYPFLVISDGFKSAVEVLYQKGIYDTDIISVQHLESVKSNHILIEERLTDREVLRKEVRGELQKTLTRQQVDEWTDADTATAKEIVAFFKDGTVKLQNDCNFYAAWLKHKLLKED